MPRDLKSDQMEDPGMDVVYEKVVFFKFSLVLEMKTLQRASKKHLMSEC